MTGYTGTMLEKKQNFQEFVLMCAHAFLIETRDSGTDSSIPDEVKPSDYHTKAMQEAQEKVQRLSAMSAGEREAYGKKQIAENNQHQNRAKKRNDGNIAKFQAMLWKVNAWNPPTKEHQGLKKFMVDQLTETIRFENYNPMPDTRTPQQAWADALKCVQQDIDYHKEQHTEEIERTSQRNKWVQELKKSLKETG